jgi:hypothetical protein
MESFWPVRHLTFGSSTGALPFDARNYGSLFEPRGS